MKFSIFAAEKICMLSGLVFDMVHGENVSSLSFNAYAGPCHVCAIFLYLMLNTRKV